MLSHDRYAKRLKKLGVDIVDFQDEAAILISRLSMLSETKIDSELKYLSTAIDKTAGQRELIAWEWLLDEVSKFRDNKSQSQT